MKSTFQGGLSGDHAHLEFYDGIDDPVFDAADRPSTQSSSSTGCASGGGLWIQSGRVTVRECNIYRNTAVRAARLMRNVYPLLLAA